MLAYIHICGAFPSQPRANKSAFIIILSSLPKRIIYRGNPITELGEGTYVAPDMIKIVNGLIYYCYNFIVFLCFVYSNCHDGLTLLMIYVVEAEFARGLSKLAQATRPAVMENVSLVLLLLWSLNQRSTMISSWRRNKLTLQSFVHYTVELAALCCPDMQKTEYLKRGI